MSKKRKRGPRPDAHLARARAIASFHRLLPQADRTEVHLNDMDRLALDQTAAAITAMQFGQAEFEHFFRLQEAAAMAWCIARELSKVATGDPEAIITTRDVAEEALAALNRVAERYAKVGRFVADADALELQRANYHNLREMSPLLTHGQMLTAMLGAKELIEPVLRKHGFKIAA